jgi:hypothetical protein
VQIHGSPLQGRYFIAHNSFLGNSYFFIIRNHLSLSLGDVLVLTLNQHSKVMKQPSIGFVEEEEVEMEEQKDDDL